MTETVTHEDLDRLEKKLDKILESLDGSNGTQGMKTRLALLERWQQDMQALVNRLYGIVIALGTTLVISLMGFLWALWTHGIQIVPKP